MQLDESKFGKRKFNKGRAVEGYWLLGAIPNDSEDFRLILCPRNCRSADVLLPIIQQHIEPGTEIHTDCWRAYDGLERLGYIHRRVNHSDPDNPFVSAEGIHTQRIESSWRPTKDFFRKYKLRQTCANCRDTRNILCAQCTPLSEECEECKNEPFICGDCRQRFRQCVECQNRKWTCNKCMEFRQEFANKVVVYQWMREAKKNGEDKFQKLIEAIRRLYPA